MIGYGAPRWVDDSAPIKGRPPTIEERIADLESQLSSKLWDFDRSIRYYFDQVTEDDSTLSARQDGRETYWDSRTEETIKRQRAASITMAHRLVAERETTETFYRNWLAALAKEASG